MRENGSLLSRVVDPPGTKGGPRAGNFPGPPKNTFCPGWSHDPGQKASTPISPFFLPLPQHLVVFLICVAPPSSPAPTAPPARRRRRPRAPSTSPTSAARPSSIRRPSAVGPPPRRRSAPLDSLVRFAAVSSTLCVPPLARSGPTSIAPATPRCRRTAASTLLHPPARLDADAAPSSLSPTWYGPAAGHFFFFLLL